MTKIFSKIKDKCYLWFLGKKPNRLVDQFKDKIIEMHDGIPNYYFWDIEKFFKHKEIFYYCINNEILVKSKEYKANVLGLVKINKKNGHLKDVYFLGINGMHLASSYTSERLTDRITIFTISLVFLTIVLVILTIVLILA